jgi:hypothetical protein
MTSRRPGGYSKTWSRCLRGDVHRWRAPRDAVGHDLTCFHCRRGLLRRPRPPRDLHPSARRSTSTGHRHWCSLSR